MYERSINTKQNDYSYEYFRSWVERIEKYFTADNSKGLRGQYVWVACGGFGVDAFVNTTVSDYREVFGPVKIHALMDIDQISNALALVTLREPYKNEFRSKIKFTPKGALSFTKRMIVEDKHGCRHFTEKSVPVLQKEKYLRDECDRLFAANASDSDYLNVSKNCWAFLERDGAFVVDQTLTKQAFTGREHLSDLLQRALSQYQDLLDLYGVTYEWNGVLFIFPMERERMKVVFANRDPVDGRRRVLPAMVKEHTRKNGSQVCRHVRGGSHTMTIEGRTFGIYMGAGDFEQTIITDKQRGNMKRHLKNAKINGDFYALEMRDRAKDLACT